MSRLSKVALLLFFVWGLTACHHKYNYYPPAHYTVDQNKYYNGYVKRYYYGNGRYSPYRYSQPRGHYHGSHYHHHHNHAPHSHEPLKGDSHYDKTSSHQPEDVYHQTSYNSSLHFVGSDEGARNYNYSEDYVRKVRVTPYLSQRLEKEYRYVGDLLCSRGSGDGSRQQNLKSCYNSLKSQAYHMGSTLIIMNPNYHLKAGPKAGCQTCVFMKGYAYKKYHKYGSDPWRKHGTPVSPYDY